MTELSPESTAGADYAQRLVRLSLRGGALRRILDPQRPYRWNLRRMKLGFTLDVGCGIGRNLSHLDGNGVGVDHNPECVAACLSKGLVAYGPDTFEASDFAVGGRFDTLLMSHVIEHMTPTEAAALISRFLRFLKPHGRVVLITPQERGQKSDATHVTFIDSAALHMIASRTGLTIESVRSFPFPRFAGRIFTPNETISVLAASASSAP
jgi:2-polyprenyl-3-methyl-5-hydroxy-6-metoxy-1,4-benzoquinol methylase